VAIVQRPAASDALRLARKKFLFPERVDMSALAEELSINRVTLYRWVGSRDRLLVEVAWSLTDDMLTEIQTHTQGRGAQRIIAIIACFLESITTNPGMRRWLTEEGEHAMRLLTRHDMDFQPRLAAAIHDLLQQEAASGALDLPVDLHELAYLIVRMIEFYAYLPLITGEASQPDRAEPILRMLLS
jgi:AcrR family transcriptional regulator